MENTNNKPSKILFLVHAFYPIHGGVERQALRQAKGLRALGYDIQVLTAKHQKDVKTKDVVEGIPVTRFRYPYWIPFKPLKKLANVIFGFFAFYRICNENNFALIHIHQAQWLTLLAYLFKKKFGYKIIVKGTNSGKVSDGMKFYSTISLLAPIGKLFGLRERVYRSFDRAICISKQMLTEFQEFGVSKERVIYIPNGLTVPGKLSPPKDYKNLSITSVIRYTDVKNPELHIKSVVEYNKRNSKLPVEFNLVGTGEQFEHWVSEVQKNNWQNIHLLGTIENSKVYELTTDSTLFMNVTRSEGLANVLLEAMACGTPFITTAVGGYKDLIGNPLNKNSLSKCEYYENGVAVKPDITPEELSFVIEEVLNDHNYCEEARTNAYNHVKNTFDIKLVLEKYNKLYQELGITKG